MKDTQTRPEIEQDERIKKELVKLRALFKNIPENRKRLVTKLIENAAFMAVLLDDLKAAIQINGYKETYQHGANQSGSKRSVSADLYQVQIKSYCSAIKQLTDLLPKDQNIDDGFEAFLAEKED